MLDATMTDHPEAASPSPDPCAGLVTAHSIVSLTDTPSATAHIALRGNGSLPWMGSETLSSYPAEGATKVVNEIRSLVERCPTATGPSGAGNILADPSLGAAVNALGPLTTHFSIADGPKLGDQSLRLQARTPSLVPGTDIEADAIVIQSGNTVIVVDELATSAQFSKLADVATAAYRQLTAR